MHRSAKDQDTALMTDACAYVLLTRLALQWVVQSRRTEKATAVVERVAIVAHKLLRLCRFTPTDFYLAGVVLILCKKCELHFQHFIYSSTEGRIS